MTPRSPAGQTDEFDRLAADPGKLWNDAEYGRTISWEQASVNRKISYLALHAAIHDVPFERFEKAVRGALGDAYAAADGPSLRERFDDARLLYGPEPAESGEHTPPLTEQQCL